MIVIIQCAATKRSDAGHLVTADGKRVVFVAHPKIATHDSACVYALPDDVSAGAKTWRDVLLEYNGAPGDNPLGLLPACRLYENRIYERLVQTLGKNKVYILSAGWGLIRSDFLTPYYDITFSPSARGDDAYKRRRKMDKYRDICMLPDDTEEEIVFFGGKDYIPLFCALTGRMRGKRKIFHSAAQAPQAPGCVSVKFETTTRTNWHYECAHAFLAGLTLRGIP
jgi:hypothetical protein